MAETAVTLWRGTVPEDWIDYNGHMTEFRYLHVFGDTSDVFYCDIGVDPENADIGAYYTLATQLRHLSECRVGTSIYTTTEVLGYDEKRVHLFHRLFDDDDKLLATGEHLAIHVAYKTAAPASTEMQGKIAALFDDQRTWPVPERVGSVLTRPLTFSRLG
ncbi:thioesterase family protein [Defluviimonas sp. SAOS-178_SWC]|uniref:thioesterase family protein n=1 Tax=Defluviimonas sp. SAOS-178_SWC TaxID=3121287 RepID=UPI0032220846